MPTNKIPKGYIACTRRNNSGDLTLQFRTTIKECAGLIHDYFLSFDFEIKSGFAYDSGHEDESNTR